MLGLQQSPAGGRFHVLYRAGLAVATVICLVQHSGAISAVDHRAPGEGHLAQHSSSYHPANSGDGRRGADKLLRLESRESEDKRGKDHRFASMVVRNSFIPSPSLVKECCCKDPKESPDAADGGSCVSAANSALTQDVIDANCKAANMTCGFQPPLKLILDCCCSTPRRTPTEEGTCAEASANLTQADIDNDCTQANVTCKDTDPMIKQCCCRLPKQYPDDSGNTCEEASVARPQETIDNACEAKNPDCTSAPIPQTVQYCCCREPKQAPSPTGVCEGANVNGNSQSVINDKCIKLDAPKCPSKDVINVCCCESPRTYPVGDTCEGPGNLSQDLIDSFCEASNPACEFEPPTWLVNVCCCKFPMEAPTADNKCEAAGNISQAKIDETCNAAKPVCGFAPSVALIRDCCCKDPKEIPTRDGTCEKVGNWTQERINMACSAAYDSCGFEPHPGVIKECCCQSPTRLFPNPQGFCEDPGNKTPQAMESACGAAICSGALRHVGRSILAFAAFLVSVAVQG
eukprot:TRINITY_DN32667_c0_g1_i1.p1 TRINITY_DN32667_c0_g1~~TRINITY_DN32667_c0_g1_i1.p1  ORF type:complete len:517 (+),score=74.52 TRINITY_DN32667_c0_g1_i1:57-1607(+)